MKQASPLGGGRRRTHDSEEEIQAGRLARRSRPRRKCASRGPTRSVTPRARPCGRPAPGRRTPAGKPLPAGRTRSSWFWRQRRGACPTCFPYVTGAWSDPRSPSTAERPSPWRPTWQPRRPQGSTSSAAGTPISATSAASPLRSGGFSSPSTTWTRRIRRPWEWDVKRLAASFVVACRDKGISDAVAKDVVMACVRSYRESMAEFSQMKTLELWYQALWAKDLVANIRP